MTTKRKQRRRVASGRSDVGRNAETDSVAADAAGVEPLFDSDSDQAEMFEDVMQSAGSLLLRGLAESLLIGATTIGLAYVTKKMMRTDDAEQAPSVRRCASCRRPLSLARIRYAPTNADIYCLACERQKSRDVATQAALNFVQALENQQREAKRAEAIRRAVEVAQARVRARAAAPPPPPPAPARSSRAEAAELDAARVLELDVDADEQTIRRIFRARVKAEQRTGSFHDHGGTAGHDRARRLISAKNVLLERAQRRARGGAHV